MAEGKHIRVIVVDDIAETRENVRKLLQFESDVEVVGVARNGMEGISLASELKPDVVLMDINMPDIDGITATERILKANPYTQVVILSVQGDSNYMRKAMLAGARDFLTKPPALDELTSAIRRAGQMAQEERSKVVSQPTVPVHGNAAVLSPGVSLGKVVTVYSPKGGAGVTTLTVNLAVTLQNEETPVVIVDGNLQFGDVAVFMNEQGKNTVADLAPRADELDPEIVEEVLVIHKASGVKILAAPGRPENAENVVGDQFGRVLKYLTRLYSYVIVDTSSTLTDGVLSALDNSDLILLLTTQEIPAIKNARLFLDLVDVLKIDRRRVLFAMNRFDKRIGITPEKVGESFKHDIAAVLPNEERVVVPSINRGVPFMLGDRSKPIARSILGLTEVMRQRLSELSGMEVEVAPNGRFGR